MTSNARRFGTASVLMGVLALVPGSPAWAQDRRSPLQVVTAPTIAGTATAGQTLVAGDGRWQSPNPGRTLARWEWYRCPTPERTAACEFLSIAPAITLTEAEASRYILLVRYLEFNGNRSWLESAFAGPVVSALPTPVPTPEPTPVATPVPVPPPPPPVPVPAPPAPTAGQVLPQTASQKMMFPRPVVRVSGVLTTFGARLSVLSVRAPRAAKVTIRCAGQCPVKRWSPAKRKTALTRVRAFERPLVAGTKLTISVTRRGYIGKRTVLTIRRGKAPQRRDDCLSLRGKRINCPRNA